MRPGVIAGWMLLVLANLTTLFGLEVLFQYQWLGRSLWPVGRMWTNLILISLLEIVVILVVLHIAALLEGLEGLLGALVFVVLSGYLYLYLLLQSTFENRAIRWPGAVQFWYMVSLLVVLVVDFLWSHYLFYGYVLPDDDDG